MGGRGGQCGGGGEGRGAGSVGGKMTIKRSNVKISLVSALFPRLVCVPLHSSCAVAERALRPLPPTHSSQSQLAAV